MKNQPSEEIAVISEISSAIIHQENVEALLDTILRILHTRMGMLRGTFTLRHGDVLEIEASHGMGETEKRRGHYKLGEGITGLVGETGQSHYIEDIRNDKRFLNRTKSRSYKDQVAFICVPLVHRDKTIGTLSVDRPVKNDTHLQNDVSFLEIIANITADAARILIDRHNERENLLEENRRLRSFLNTNPSQMVGVSSRMQLVFEQIQQVAPSDATVMIRGASGTGKELVARAIVDGSPRKDKPFIAVNCAAIPSDLLESELFGHEKGAFTGAVNRRTGRAEAADGGTLFLDEIGDLPPALQVKLLRFLQERTFSRVGSNEELTSNVRFITATSRNLEDLMEKGLFREDLYYRLNVFPITVPSLSQRKSDIPLLCEHFIEKMNLKYQKKVTHISPEATALLAAHPWPGNVRELENCMERAVLTAQGNTIERHNLPNAIQSVRTTGDESGKALIDILMSHYERDVLATAIKRHDGNFSAAGRELGISPRMMNYRMKRAGLID